MGCNIHLHVEIKVYGNWYHYHHPHIKRNYDLFAKMAGVENKSTDPITPLSKPKGLPEDATFTTRFDSDCRGVDGHSHSFLTSSEIVLLDEWCREQSWFALCWFEREFGYLFGNTYSGLVRYPDDYPPELQDFRFVFWFDN